MAAEITILRIKCECGHIDDIEYDENEVIITNDKQSKGALKSA